MWWVCFLDITFCFNTSTSCLCFICVHFVFHFNDLQRFNDFFFLDSLNTYLLFMILSLRVVQPSPQKTDKHKWRLWKSLSSLSFLKAPSLPVRTYTNWKWLFASDSLHHARVMISIQRAVMDKLFLASYLSPRMSITAATSETSYLHCFDQVTYIIEQHVLFHLSET